MAAKKKSKKIEDFVQVPDNIEARMSNHTLKIKGPKGETEKKFAFPNIKINTENKKISFVAEKASKRDKRAIGSMKAHIKNMMHGVLEGYTYKLKICSGHFPMNVAVSGDTFTVKNFIGETIPRALKIKKNASVKIDGNFVVVESIDKEIAGQVSADIEQLTRRTSFDRRVFQDGIYIISKAGKAIK